LRANTGSTITVTALDWPLNGIVVRDLFVVEDLAPARR